MNLGFQQLWLAGSRVYFQRDPIASAVQPIIDLGRVEPVSPTLNPTILTLKDADGGLKRTIAEAVSEIDETYEVRFNNLNLENLAMLFLGKPPESFTQAADAVTDVVHAAHPGKLVKIRNSAGLPVYGITSIQAVTGPSGTPSYTQGTDWEIVSLERGLIRMIDGGAFATAGNIEIDYTPRAITGLRLVKPQTSGSIQGMGLFIWSRGPTVNQFQTVREARVSITPTAAQFGIDDWSQATFRMTTLSDPTIDPPAGRLIYWLGDLPAKS